MNDPTGNTGRIEPCSTAANKVDALSRLGTAVVRAEKALEYYKEDKVFEAFEQWDLLWNGKFPDFTSCSDDDPLTASLRLQS
jgi:hypothetical protein